MRSKIVEDFKSETALFEFDEPKNDSSLGDFSAVMGKKGLWFWVNHYVTDKEHNR